MMKGAGSAVGIGSPGMNVTRMHPYERELTEITGLVL